MKTEKTISKNQKADSKKENLDSKNVKSLTEEVEKTVKANIYKFDYQNLDSDSLKKKRQNARNKLNAFVRDIINYSDLQKDSEKLEKSVSEFQKFYSEIYILNDYSTKSLRNKIEEKEKKDLERMLEIVKLETEKGSKKGNNKK